MMLTSYLLATACLISSIIAPAFALVSPRASPSPYSDFTNNVVFVPGSNYTSWRTLYARTLQLPDESLLITWEDYPPEPPLVYFPIYRSTDGGATWNPYSQVEDQVNGWGMRYQPFLYTLPQPMGIYAAGTILIVGPSVPQNLSEAYIDMYASTDGGQSWSFVSHIAYGAGPESTPNGNQAIWEPFLVTYNNQLICYFSDQRDPNYAQKLVYVTTSDLVNWSGTTDVVAVTPYSARPGMATVAHIETTDQWIMTFEYCGGLINGQPSNGCPAYYKTASSPLEFGSATPNQIASNSDSNMWPNGNPYVLWVPNANPDGSGIVIMNGNSYSELFLNSDSAGVDGWTTLDVGQYAAYSRSLREINDNGTNKLLIANGGNMGNGANNYVVVGVVPIPSISS